MCFLFALLIFAYLVLAGDVGSDRGAAGGAGKCSCSRRAANLLSAALWPPGQDLPEGLYLARPTLTWAMVKIWFKQKLNKDFDLCCARLRTAWGNVSLPQTLPRPPSLWTASCSWWIQDTANWRSELSLLTNPVIFYCILGNHLWLKPPKLNAPLTPSFCIVPTGFQSSHWNGRPAGLSHQSGQRQPAFRQSRQNRTRTVLQVAGCVLCTCQWSIDMNTAK